MGGHIHVDRMRSVHWTHHVINTVVASEIVRAAQVVDVREVRELNERVSDISDGVHDRWSLGGENGSKVMGECDSWSIVLDHAKL
jgi:hypothetical protein